MRITFDVHVELDETRRSLLKRDLAALLRREFRPDDSPATVVISRPTTDPDDERILAEITSESGIFLGSIVGEADGSGRLMLMPPGY
jgi:hypothetical protein